MTVQLKEGVFHHFQAMPQLKTIRVKVALSKQVSTPAELGQLSLIQLFLQQACAKYPTKQALSQAFSRLYGAKLGVSTQKRGKNFHLFFDLTVVNPRFLPGKPAVAKDGMALLQEILFAPLAKDASFLEPQFSQERTRVQQYFKALLENKKLVAFNNTLANYFTDPLLQAPVYANTPELAATSAHEAWQLYHAWLTTARVDIAVVGDLTANEAQQLAEQLPFAARTPGELPREQVVASKPQTTVTDTEANAQSRLNLLYRFDADCYGADFCPLLVFNELFGGSALSLLFDNVRERHSLAYTIGSRLLLPHHLVLVESGVAAANLEQATELINEQLRTLQEGNVSEERFASIKAGLISGIVEQSDSASVVSYRLINSALAHHEVSRTEVLKQIDQVTLTQVQAIAQSLKLQLVYQLRGGAE